MSAFREVEGLRITLAKHEVPKSKGVPAVAVGFVRVVDASGTLGFDWVDHLSVKHSTSRRDLVRAVLDAANSFAGR